MKLIARGTTIEFKSNKDVYNKEIKGVKRNTVRIFNPLYILERDEVTLIERYRETIEYIRIKSTEVPPKGQSKKFVRKLTDITSFENHGLIIYIFSW